jgi:hypothetical protein
MPYGDTFLASVVAYFGRLSVARRIGRREAVRLLVGN